MRCLTTTTISWALALSSGLLAAAYRHHIETIPAAQSNLTSIAQYTSSHNGLDAPHVTPINESAYDWWYFDAYSEDSQTSVVVVFFAAPATAFPFSRAPPAAITEAYLFVSVPGQPFLVSQAIPATQATLDLAGDGASGDWTGSGFSFRGKPDLSEYSIAIDHPGLACKGELSFKSKAPAHYPCGRAQSGVTMEIMPNVGWANAIPDAVAEVHLSVNGTAVDFTGIGYHDKNWGDKPFTHTVGSWFWGHGRLGPYSIVWYDALTPAGAEHVSAYVARDGQVVEVAGGRSCRAGSVKVRPAGPQDAYPPSLAGKRPSGAFRVEIDLGDEGAMVVDVTPSVEVAVVPGRVGEVYNRWTGRLKGGVLGEEAYVGTALYEQFTLTV